MQGAVNRAFVGDLQQPPTFLRRQVPPHLDDPLDAVDLAFLRLAGCAVLGVNLPVRKGDPRPLEREALALGVEPEGHRGAGAERRQQEIVWRRAHVEAADALRLVGGEAMRSDRSEEHTSELQSIMRSSYAVFC